MSSYRECMLALRRPFDVRKLKWRPTEVWSGTALALVYIDARDVIERLDEVVPGEWQERTMVQFATWEISDREDAAVRRCTWLFSATCRLTIRGVTRTGTGEGDTAKAADSDALKRAAVRHGVGLYLYHFPLRRVAYDDRRKTFAEEPPVPKWAHPEEWDRLEAQRADIEDEDGDGGLETEETAKATGQATELSGVDQGVDQQTGAGDDGPVWAQVDPKTVWSDPMSAAETDVAICAALHALAEKMDGGARGRCPWNGSWTLFWKAVGALVPAGVTAQRAGKALLASWPGIEPGKQTLTMGQATSLLSLLNTDDAAVRAVVSGWLQWLATTPEKGV